MKIATKIEKNDLDYQIVSLTKQIEDYDLLLYYYGEEIGNEVNKVKQDINDKIKRLIQLYNIL